MGLEEFGAGVEIDAPNKEDKDNIELSRWLAGPDVDIYWDRTKSYGFGTFKTDLRTTPDLVIDAHNRTYAVEVKPPDSSSNIYDGAEQAERYWREIESGEAAYKIEGEPTEIDAVLLATRNSPNGHLFETVRGKDPRRPGRSRGAMQTVNSGHMPTVEHAGSEALMRTMYRFARRWYENSDQDTTETGLGVLYSLALDGGPAGLASTPAAFYISPGNGNKSHNWQSIPWHKKDG